LNTGFLHHRILPRLLRHWTTQYPDRSNNVKQLF
jgi:hypothetical protein